MKNDWKWPPAHMEIKIFVDEKQSSLPGLIMFMSHVVYINLPPERLEAS